MTIKESMQKRVQIPQLSVILDLLITSQVQAPKELSFHPTRHRWKAKSQINKPQLWIKSLKFQISTMKLWKGKKL